ncbi:DUF6221 family protein [Streptomyces albogriseolus]|uniref:DUF6221 family protein n=1 Tax=Streptomyces albogriseolus TaxID=1887 RepID=UPI00345FD8DE
MDELVRWLGAQLDEDERTAREAGGAAWEELPVSGWVHTSPLPDTEWQPPGYDHHVASAPLPSDRAHIVRHGPARVLSEVAAKRQIIERCTRVQGLLLDDFTAEHLADDVLALLALAYAGRPGYREEWRP